MSGKEIPLIAIVCVDDSGGTMFHKRRQSQDRVLREQVLQDAADRRLWMNAYSRKLFGEAGSAAILVDEDFPAKAGPGDFCFVEGLALQPWMDRIERVVLYRWNRKYPADTFLDLRLDGPPWKLVQSSEFAGSSHEMITKEVYER